MTREAGQEQPEPGLSLAERDDEGLVIVDEAGRVRIVDHRARELLGDLLHVGDVLPPLLLAAASVELSELRDERASDVALRIVPARLDRQDGWAISVAEPSAPGGRHGLALERLAVVAHELRTPLASIIGYADVLLGDDLDLDLERRHRFLRTILQQGVRLSGMVNDLAVLTTADHGLTVRPRPVQLDRAVDDALPALGDGAAVERRGGEGVVALADPGHVERIVLNLVANALKYGLPPVTVELDRDRDEAVIRVRDRGAGVDDGFRARMWEAFERSREGGVADDVPGSGLGLAVVATLTSVNGGRYWYEDNEPTGACFAVSLPLAGEPAPPTTL